MISFRGAIALILIVFRLELERINNEKEEELSEVHKRLV